MLLTPGATTRAVRAIIARRELPAEIASLIGSVVRRTRLRHHEQIDIAAELASHFAEGLARGADAASLVRDFGDPRATARRLRHGAIAKRSPADRAMRLALRGLGASMAALLVAYVLAAIWLSTRTPTITFDFVAEAQRRMPAVGPEGSAIPTYVRALAGPDGTEALTKGDAEKERSAVLTLLPRVAFDPDAEARVRRWIDANRARLDALRTLPATPVIGVPLAIRDTPDMRLLATLLGLPDASTLEQEAIERARSPESAQSPMLWIILPQLRMIRNAAQCVSVDAAMAARDGDTTRFMECIRAMDSMCGHASEPVFIVGALVSASVRIMMASTIVSAIENHGSAFSDAQLAELRSVLARTDDGMGRGLEGERLMFHDHIQRCYTSDGSGGGVAIPGALSALIAAAGTSSDGPGHGSADSPELMELALGPLMSFGTANRRDVQRSVDRMYDALAAACQSDSLEDARDAATALDREIGAIDRIRNPFPAMLMPALGNTALQRWRLQRTREIAQAAIGIEQFQRARGRFPESLDELRAFVGIDLGRWLDRVSPWQYAILDGRPLIWDSGGDERDDAARLPPSPRIADLEVVPAGDTLRLLAMDLATPDLRQTEFGGRREGLPKDLAPDPRQSIADIASFFEVGELPGVARWHQGDCALVWWGSGATGPSRLTIARPANP
ncbi:MAG: hypothetical protein FGM37_05180 [Phycisphaerales bacterium]|nr:hypothetical protein [Phycisphaerales bacterium]